MERINPFLFIFLGPVAASIHGLCRGVRSSASVANTGIVARVITMVVCVSRCSHRDVFFVQGDPVIALGGMFPAAHTGIVCFSR